MDNVEKELNYARETIEKNRGNFNLELQQLPYFDTTMTPKFVNALDYYLDLINLFMRFLARRR